MICPMRGKVALAVAARVAVAAASVCAEAAAEEPPHAPHARPPAASGLLSEMQCLVFIATLLAEQDAAFAAQEAGPPTCAGFRAVLCGA